MHQPPLRIAASDDADIPASHRGLVLAVGNFDGVHRGHQALIAVAEAEASSLGTRAGVLSFEPHPRTVLRPEAPTFRLAPPGTRSRILGAVGIDAIVELRFDAALAALAPEAFVRDFLAGRLGVAGIVVGEDFRFGHKRSGDVALLRRLGDELGFTVRALPAVLREDGEPFSSGRIRNALAAGDIAAVNAMLGYRWRTTGPVIHGDKRGRELGYPTANIRLETASALRHGIYAVMAAWPGQPTRSAVASFGVRPTFLMDAAPLLEVHVFDFDGDLYGKEMTVTFLAWLRPEERFEGIESLVAQIDRDAAAARAINAAAGPGSAIDRALDRMP
ncbi:MAG: bifunctional riboflavin kinase/FAD synthetase [Bauldia sp.]|nr:bifunctional riboflavin kinase/FAD synthetase [Bauldia sp.]